MHEEAHAGSGPECQLCPVCALVRAVGGTQPEVVEHLASAARELALALRAVVDAHLGEEGASAGGAHLERIRID